MNHTKMSFLLDTEAAMMLLQKDTWMQFNCKWQQLQPRPEQRLVGDEMQPELG